MINTNINTIFINKKEKKIGDFYWAYADILRGIGINESMYDQRIMAFMAIKLLIDNQKVKFNFDYQNNFGLDYKTYVKYKGKNSKETFLNIIKNINKFGKNLKYFNQDKIFNPNQEYKNILYYLNHKKTFTLELYIDELPNNYLENVLNIYNEKADFTDYPKEQYKDLYEITISRMKKLSGDLTGQHFTQKSIIHLMCESAIGNLKKSKSDRLAIYDPACGTGSMLMESYFYFKENGIDKPIEVYGQEYHGQVWLLCKIFLEISEINNIIAYGNTLANPVFDKINGSDSFDFIIANPPFGMDWKHDYEAVIKNMKLDKKSNYLVVFDEKGKIITPKKNDGQFLFMLHIMKLMQVSKDKNKHAIAAVISSSTLISNGNQTSSEAKIRKQIFDLNYLQTLLEQPNAMFTNTDINSNIWFFDNFHNSTKVKIVKSSDKKNNLFILHPQPKDKMKNTYNNKNIKDIISLFRRKDKKYISRTIDIKDKYTVKIADLIKTEIAKDISIEELFNNIEKSFKNLCDLKILRD